MHYQATPAEMLFNYKLSTKLPHVFVKKDNKEIAQILQDHDRKKRYRK